MKKQKRITKKGGSNTLHIPMAIGKRITKIKLNGLLKGTTPIHYDGRRYYIILGVELLLKTDLKTGDMLSVEFSKDLKSMEVQNEK